MALGDLYGVADDAASLKASRVIANKYEQSESQHEVDIGGWWF
ncbi:unannotated protein [freshwater metagenome]|uniref:Unannotated protein n=1 Tax=freshwater metagenome TaxID=449393 RepID=A0A6J6UI40_9ZZZZ